VFQRIFCIRRYLFGLWAGAGFSPVRYGNTPYALSALNTQTGDITEFDDKLVRKLIEKVIVYDNRLVIEFKSGLEIEA